MQDTKSHTRDALIEVARRLFAERGFYGTSVAAIAADLDITKQALLHHFGTKEKLYAEVLGQLSGVYTDTLAAARRSRLPPQDQVRAFFTGFCVHAIENPEDVRLIMRELLDNKERADTADQWYLRGFLNDLASLLSETPRWQGAATAEVRSAAYQLLGAICYFAISEPTLGRIFGQGGLGEMRSVFPDILDELVTRQVSN